MNLDQLKTIAQQNELLWNMYRERQYYDTWQRALAVIKQLSQPQKEAPASRKSPLKGRPSPLRGRKLSPEHIAKLKKPKTEEQKAALRVPKRDSSKMGRYKRDEQYRKAAAARARGRKKSQEELAKIAASKTGPKNPLYKKYVFGAVHPIHGMFYGERYELHKRFPKELPLHELRRLAIGQYSSYKGWRLVQKAKR